jgi:hypothetical protein
MKEPEERPVRASGAGWLVLLILAQRARESGLVSVAAQRCTSATRQDNRTSAFAKGKTGYDRERHKQEDESNMGTIAAAKRVKRGLAREGND